MLLYMQKTTSTCFRWGIRDMMGWWGRQTDSIGNSEQAAIQTDRFFLLFHVLCFFVWMVYFALCFIFQDGVQCRWSPGGLRVSRALELLLVHCSDGHPKQWDGYGLPLLPPPQHQRQCPLNGNAPLFPALAYTCPDKPRQKVRKNERLNIKKGEGEKNLWTFQLNLGQSQSLWTLNSLMCDTAKYVR